MKDDFTELVSALLLNYIAFLYPVCNLQIEKSGKEAGLLCQGLYSLTF